MGSGPAGTATAQDGARPGADSATGPRTTPHPNLAPALPPQPHRYPSASASLCVSPSLPWDFSLLFSPLFGEPFTTLPHGPVNTHTHANRLRLGLTDTRQLGSAQTDTLALHGQVVAVQETWEQPGGRHPHGQLFHQRGPQPCPVCLLGESKHESILAHTLYSGPSKPISTKNLSSTPSCCKKIFEDLYEPMQLRRI